MTALFAGRFEIRAPQGAGKVHWPKIPSVYPTATSSRVT